MKFRIYIACILLFSCTNVILGQTRKSRKPVVVLTPTAPPSEPALTPLTEVETNLNLQKLISNQPDFVADEIFFYNEGFGGFSAKQRIARKGTRSFFDTGFVKVLVDPDKEIRLDDKQKTYEEIPIRKDFIVGNGHPINPRLLTSENGFSLTALGTQIIESKKCLKIEAKKEGEPYKIYLYAAEKFKYLIIVAQIFNPPRSSVQRLENISLSVPSQLLEIPLGFKPLPKHKWLRDNSVQLTYENKTQKNFSVFRSEDQNQYFITVQEPHPATGLLLEWHYIIDLKQQSVGIGYQGLLLTALGDFAWRTSEKEAFSKGDNHPTKGSSPCRSIKCPKNIFGTNFVQFPTVYYEDRKSIIRLSW